MTITGKLTSSGYFILAGDGDTATIGGNLTNSGYFLLTEGSKAIIGGTLINEPTGRIILVNQTSGDLLQVNGNLDNSGNLTTNFVPSYGGNTLTVGGMLINEATGQINLDGSGDLLQALGGLTNYGSISANNGSSIDPPFVNNGGTINIDSLSKFVVGTGSPAGLGYI